jgi:hypothetical protein
MNKRIEVLLRDHCLNVLEKFKVEVVGNVDYFDTVEVHEMNLGIKVIRRIMDKEFDLKSLGFPISSLKDDQL